MEQQIEVNLNETQQQIFEKISKNETDNFKQLIAQLKGGVNFVDENGMTPLQHACCKGNKEAVQILMDMVSINEQQLIVHVLHYAFFFITGCRCQL